MKRERNLLTPRKSSHGSFYERGVDGKGIAEIRAVGDEALFGGYSTEQMKKKVGCDEDRPLADFLSTVVIKAKVWQPK